MELRSRNSQPDALRGRTGQHTGSVLRFLLFDLDETLYPAQTGMFDEIGQLINRYMEERVGIPPQQVLHLRRLYYERYGTTLRGLQIHHQVDPEDYLTYVHQVDLTSYIHPNPALDQALAGLPQEKAIFTNATAEHARRVVEVVGVSHHFQRIFDIRALGYFCKPLPQAYQIVLKALPAVGPECLLIDDTLRNLRAGHEAGMHTLWIGARPGPQDGTDYCATDVVRVGEVVLDLMPGQVR